MYDADAYRAAAQRPAIKVDGAIYTGKLISFDQALEFQARLKQGEQFGSEAKAVIQDLCRAIDLPAEIVLGLPPGAVLGALQSFFACLLGNEPSNPEPSPAPQSN